MAIGFKFQFICEGPELRAQGPGVTKSDIIKLYNAVFEVFTAVRRLIFPLDSEP